MMERNPPQLLVVDDEEAICDLVKSVATIVGYEVTTVTDSRKIFDEYSDAIGVIVLDLTMPGIDGVEIIRYLASANSQATLILISGFDPGVLHSATELAKEHGLHVAGSLEKPFSLKELQHLLGEIPRQAAKAEPATPGVRPSADELRQAIQNQEIVAYFQPKVDIRTGFLVAFEALARWQHPQHGVLMPDTFIALAEEHGLIQDLTDLMIHAAIKRCSKLRAAGVTVQMAVNLSARTLTDLKFPDKLQEKLRMHGLDPSQLIIEVTESAIIEDVSRSLDILTRIRMKGIHLSIDDFGTGYSSIQMLYRGPFDELKVDRSFVSRMVSKNESRTIVETSIDLAQKMRMKATAEGVEDEATWNLLGELGCTEAHGHFIGAAMPGQNIKQWLEEWKDRQLALFPMPWLQANG